MILVTDGRVINITEGQELTSIESKKYLYSCLEFSRE